MSNMFPHWRSEWLAAPLTEAGVDGQKVPDATEVCGPGESADSMRKAAPTLW